MEDDDFITGHLVQSAGTGSMSESSIAAGELVDRAIAGSLVPDMGSGFCVSEAFAGSIVGDAFAGTLVENAVAGGSSGGELSDGGLAPVIPSSGIMTRETAVGEMPESTPSAGTTKDS